MNQDFLKNLPSSLANFFKPKEVSPLPMKPVDLQPPSVRQVAAEIPGAVGNAFSKAKETIFPKPITYYKDTLPLKNVQKIVGTVSQQNNNPGNLIFMEQPGATRGEERPDGTYWAKFETPEVGHLAGQKDIQAKIKRNPNMTIGELVSLRSPASENNVSDVLYNVLDELWDLRKQYPTLNKNFLVKNLPIERVEDALAKAEGFYSNKNTSDIAPAPGKIK